MNIMLSVRPNWCEDILNREKTLEIRKTCPKGWKDYLSGKIKVKPEPMKCYIYCTKGQPYLIDCRDTDFDYDYDLINHYLAKFDGDAVNGKVVAEFVCSEIDKYKYHRGLPKFGGELGLPMGTFDSYIIFEDDYKSMCLSYDEVRKYGNGDDIYAWHIDDLKIYDEPRELSEFKSKNYCVDKPICDCINCDWSICSEPQGLFDEPRVIACGRMEMTHPPQSWCYCVGV